MNTQSVPSPAASCPESLIASKLSSLGRDLVNLDHALTNLLTKIQPVSAPRMEGKDEPKSPIPRVVQSEVADTIDNLSDSVNALTARVSSSIDLVQC